MSPARRGILMSVALVALGLTAVGSARPAATPTKIFEIGNIYGVSNGASAPSIFTTSKPWTIVEVWTYHWNDAKGTTATGTVGLKSLATGKMYGPWSTVGSEGQGGVPNAYWHTTVKVTIPAGRYKVVDSSPATWAQNSETAGRGMTWIMALPAADLTWPALPDALVSIASVSNGCGGGVASNAKRYGDTSVYLNSNNPFGTRYTVNFRSACNLHDAGYSGAKVHDVLSGKTIDYYTWNQAGVDEKFLTDMQKICEIQIPPEASVAIQDCQGNGGKTSLGAKSRYDFVTTAGSLFWRNRPNLNGGWTQGSGEDAVRLNLSQDVRSVTGSWQSGTGDNLLKGEFRGTLISRDQDSIVKGYAKVTKGGTTAIRPMSFTVDPDTPNRIEAAGLGLAGTLTRA